MIRLTIAKHNSKLRLRGNYAKQLLTGWGRTVGLENLQQMSNMSASNMHLAILICSQELGIRKARAGALDGLLLCLDSDSLHMETKPRANISGQCRLACLQTHRKAV